MAGAQCYYKEALCNYQRALVINLCRLNIFNFRDFYLLVAFTWTFFVRLHSLTNLEIGFYMNFIPKHQACQTLLKVTRPVVLWLKEMVMMVFRRGSESNIKSDLGIWAKYLFLKHSLYIFIV